METFVVSIFRIYGSFLLTILESLCKIHRDLKLFYDISIQSINIAEHKINIFQPFRQIFVTTGEEQILKNYNQFICWAANYHSKDLKIILEVIWIFQIFSIELFIKSFECGLIFCRNSASDKCSYLSPIHCYSIYLPLNMHIWFLCVHNNLFYLFYDL